jgi:hypothetical protein
MVVKGGSSKIAIEYYVQSSPATTGSTRPGATDTKLAS